MLIHGDVVPDPAPCPVGGCPLGTICVTTGESANSPQQNTGCCPDPDATTTTTSTEEPTTTTTEEISTTTTTEFTTTTTDKGKTCFCDDVGANFFTGTRVDCMTDCDDKTTCQKKCNERFNPHGQQKVGHCKPDECELCGDNNVDAGEDCDQATDMECFTGVNPPNKDGICNNLKPVVGPPVSKGEPTACKCLTLCGNGKVDAAHGEKCDPGSSFAAKCPEIAAGVDTDCSSGCECACGDSTEAPGKKPGQQCDVPGSGGQVKGTVDSKCQCRCPPGSGDCTGQMLGGSSSCMIMGVPSTCTAIGSVCGCACPSGSACAGLANSAPCTPTGGTFAVGACDKCDCFCKDPKGSKPGDSCNVGSLPAGSGKLDNNCKCLCPDSSTCKNLQPGSDCMVGEKPGKCDSKCVCTPTKKFDCTCFYHDGKNFKGLDALSGIGANLKCLTDAECATKCATAPTTTCPPAPAGFKPLSGGKPQCLPNPDC